MVVMCEVKSKVKMIAKKKEVQWLTVKKKDCDEPHLAPNEKMQPIQWTEWPTSALVAVGSFWPRI
jgi:hypothetical protein